MTTLIEPPKLTKEHLIRLKENGLRAFAAGEALRKVLCQTIFAITEFHKTIERLDKVIKSEEEP